MKDTKLFSNSSSPTKEEVSNNTKGRVASLLTCNILNELPKSRLEGSGGMEEANDERVRKNIGVFSVGREAMIGAIKGNFKKTNGRVRRERRVEFVEVERSVNKGDVVVLCLLYMKG